MPCGMHCILVGACHKLLAGCKCVGARTPLNERSCFVPNVIMCCLVNVDFVLYMKYDFRVRFVLVSALELAIKIRSVDN